MMKTHQRTSTSSSTTTSTTWESTFLMITRQIVLIIMMMLVVSCIANTNPGRTSFVRFADCCSSSSRSSSYFILFNRRRTFLLDSETAEKSMLQKSFFPSRSPQVTSSTSKNSNIITSYTMRSVGTCRVGGIIESRIKSTVTPKNGKISMNSKPPMHAGVLSIFNNNKNPKSVPPNKENGTQLMMRTVGISTLHMIAASELMLIVRAELDKPFFLHGGGGLLFPSSSSYNNTTTNSMSIVGVIRQINIGVFLTWFVTTTLKNNVRLRNFMTRNFLLRGDDIRKKDTRRIHRILLSGFSHIEFDHLENNLSLLDLFGPVVERSMGKRNFAYFYVCSLYVSSLFDELVYGPKKGVFKLIDVWKEGRFDGSYSCEIIRGVGCHFGPIILRGCIGTQKNPFRQNQNHFLDDMGDDDH